MAGNKNSGTLADVRGEKKEALVNMWLARCTFPSHHYEGTQYLHCVCVSPNGEVLGSGFAQRDLDHEFVREVAYGYAMQEAKVAAKDSLNYFTYEVLLERFNKI